MMSAIQLLSALSQPLGHCGNSLCSPSKSSYTWWVCCDDYSREFLFLTPLSICRGLKAVWSLHLNSLFGKIFHRWLKMCIRNKQCLLIVTIWGFIDLGPIRSKLSVVPLSLDPYFTFNNGCYFHTIYSFSFSNFQNMLEIQQNIKTINQCRSVTEQWYVNIWFMP